MACAFIRLVAGRCKVRHRAQTRPAWPWSLGRCRASWPRHDRSHAEGRCTRDPTGRHIAVSQRLCGVVHIEHPQAPAPGFRYISVKVSLLGSVHATALWSGSAASGGNSRKRKLPAFQGPSQRNQSAPELHRHPQLRRPSQAPGPVSSRSRQPRTAAALCTVAPASTHKFMPAMPAIPHRRTLAAGCVHTCSQRTTHQSDQRRTSVQ